VLIQRMIDADVAGVAFSADPVSGRRSVAVVAAAPGVGTGVVSGERDADTFHVARDGCVVRLGTVATAPCLDDTQVSEIAALARRCARSVRQCGSPFRARRSFRACSACYCDP
jgi:pyruvate,water dikinase